MECLSGGLEIVSINNNDYVLCILCAQSQYLERPSAGSSDSNHGNLACYDNYTQGELISMYRDLHISRLHISKHGHRANNKSLYQVVEDTLTDLENKVSTIQSVVALGIKNQRISGYVSIYKYASPKLISMENDIFGKIRYTPNIYAFEDILNYWYSTSYKSIINQLK
jgi:hypothetical protein